MTIPNIVPFIKAVGLVPQVQLKFMRQEMSRGLKRMRKSFIKTQLKGPPGINAGILAKGRNVFTYVHGKSLPELGGGIGISRILHVHEIGMTIRPKTGKFLYIQERSKGTRVMFQKGSKEKSRIIAAVPQVVIPSRLKFRAQMNAEAPHMLRRVAAEGQRATEVTLTKGLLKDLHIK